MGYVLILSIALLHPLLIFLIFKFFSSFSIYHVMHHRYHHCHLSFITSKVDLMSKLIKMITSNVPKPYLSSFGAKKMASLLDQSGLSPCSFLNIFDASHRFPQSTLSRSFIYWLISLIAWQVSLFRISYVLVKSNHHALGLIIGHSFCT